MITPSLTRLVGGLALSLFLFDWWGSPSCAKAEVEIEEIAIVLIAKTEERERVHFYGN